MENKRLHELIAEDFLFVCNHSGGKDSQAMMIEMLKAIPARNMVVIHATLGEFEWPGALELAKKQAEEAGVAFRLAKAISKTGDEWDFFKKVEHRKAMRPDSPAWPSDGNRWCTSDLKRGPITRETLRYMKENGFKNVVNCVGLRAEESTERKNHKPWTYLNEALTKDGKPKNEPLARAGRKAYEWLPIHDMTREEVFATIAAAGQEPHWAYAKGNDRLSCVFCIYGCVEDLANGARNFPELYKRYVEMEAKIGFPMHLKRKPLAELVAAGESKLAAKAAV